MNTCVFLGPSLSQETAMKVLDATYLPPASHGDIYRATLRQPKPIAIGLIDGFFRQRPAVRHKEILWAMAQGIHVFGAASIGALRAAELLDFGMIGVGKVFAQYRDGVLEDDDEVAVDHGPKELRFPAMNEALVDMRVTFEQAFRERIICAQSHDHLLQIAKQSYYAERSFPHVISLAIEQGLSLPDAETLQNWLPVGRKSQKSEDALLMLEELRVFLDKRPGPLKVSYKFSRTETWDRDVAFAAALPTDSLAKELRRGLIVEEARLSPGDYKLLRGDALRLALCRREAERSKIAVSREEALAFLETWQQVNDLRTPEKLAQWRLENNLDETAFDSFILARAREEKLEWMARDLVDEFCLDALRVNGLYSRFRERALKKMGALEAAGLSDASLLQSGISADELLSWFCRERLGRPMPLDAEVLAKELAFADAEALQRAILREWLYLRVAKPSESARQA